MNGKELKKAVRNSGLKVSEIVEKSGIAERQLYNLYTKDKVHQHNNISEDVWKKYEASTKSLSNLITVFDKATTLQKQKLLNLVFNHSLKYQLNTFLCEDVMPMFALNAASLKKKGLLEISKPLTTLGNLSLSTPDRNIVELFELLKSIA